VPRSPRGNHLNETQALLNSFISWEGGREGEQQEEGAARPQPGADEKVTGRRKAQRGAGEASLTKACLGSLQTQDRLLGQPSGSRTQGLRQAGGPRAPRVGSRMCAARGEGTWPPE
jgi:hypothetical protein